MTGPRATTWVAVALAALTLAAAGCNGDGEKATTSPAPAADAPSPPATPPSDPGQLPPEFIECMAKKGFDVESSADIHSAPPPVLRACFGALHEGGGGP